MYWFIEILEWFKSEFCSLLFLNPSHKSWDLFLFLYFTIVYDISILDTILAYDISETYFIMTLHHADDASHQSKSQSLQNIDCQTPHFLHVHFICDQITVYLKGQGEYYIMYYTQCIMHAVHPRTTHLLHPHGILSHFEAKFSPSHKKIFCLLLFTYTWTSRSALVHQKSILYMYITYHIIELVIVLDLSLFCCLELQILILCYLVVSRALYTFTVVYLQLSIYLESVHSFYIQVSVLYSSSPNTSWSLLVQHSYVSNWHEKTCRKLGPSIWLQFLCTIDG